MNNQRRKAIKALYPDLEALGPLADTVKVAMVAFQEAAETIWEQIEAIRDEEQEYIDNLPENLAQSEKAQVAEQAVSDLDDVMDMLIEENTSDFDNFSVDDVVGKLDEVAGGEF